MASNHHAGGTKKPWFEPPCYVLFAHDDLEEVVGGARKHEPRAEHLQHTCSALGSIEAGGLCGENEGPTKMTHAKMAFFSRTSSSASKLEQIINEVPTLYWNTAVIGDMENVICASRLLLRCADDVAQ